MRQKLHYFIYVVVLVTSVTFFGCNENAFDFSQLDEVDANGDWGFPLLNAEYTIGDILDMSGDIGYLQQGSDGTVELRYEYTFDSIISASKYLDSYFNQDISVEGSKTFSSFELPPVQGNVQLLYNDTIVAQFPADMILLESAELESGQIELQINYNIQQPTWIKVTCPQLTSSTGQPLHLEAQSSGGNYSTTLSLDGYSLTVPSDNEIEILMEVSCDANIGSLPAELSFEYHAAFQQVVFREIRGRFVAVDIPVDEEWDFDSQFLRDHISGNMTLLNPQVTCEIMNSFPVEGTLLFEQAELSGGGNSASLLAYSPATVEVPGNTSGFVPVNLPIANSLLLSPDYSHFKLKGNAVINPDGFNTPTLVFREDQVISLRISVVLPLDIDMDDLTFCDTVQFGGISLPSESAFSNMLLRLGITNGLPLNFELQAYFYDSQTATVKDSLFTEKQIVLSAMDGTPRFSELFATKENFEEVQNMFSCDNIILQARLFTDGRPISINVAQSVRFKLGARMNVDMNGLVNLGNN
jgi:hypothetical protein